MILQDAFSFFIYSCPVSISITTPGVAFRSNDPETFCRFCVKKVADFVVVWV